MATVGKFENFEVWQKARALSQEIYRVSGIGAFYNDFGLKNQIRKTSGSIMDNIAEGAERSGNGEFMQFLSIAKGSAGELRSQLYRALDQDYIDQEEFNDLSEKTLEISKMAMSLIQYLKQSKFKGERFKTKHTNANFGTQVRNFKP